MCRLQSTVVCVKAACMQDNSIAAQLAPLATTAVELAGKDKFTLFAPADSAFEAIGEVPTGNELAEVRSLRNSYRRNTFYIWCRCEDCAGV